MTTPMARETVAGDVRRFPVRPKRAASGTPRFAAAGYFFQDGVFSMGQVGTWVVHARQDRRAGRLTLRRVLVENGLSLTLATLFLVMLVGQAWTGHLAYNEEQRDHGAAPVTLGGYLLTGHFLEATAENWESEFLQMAAFVWLTSFLFQKGSPESKDPYDRSEDRLPVTAQAPWIYLRQRGSQQSKPVEAPHAYHE
jgi:hypothetical protein